MRVLLIIALMIISLTTVAETIECQNTDLDIRLTIITSLYDFPEANMNIDFNIGEIKKQFELVGFYKSGYSFDTNEGYSGYDIPLNGDPLTRKELISYSFYNDKTVGEGYIDMKEFELNYAKLQCLIVNESVVQINY